ncbi:hypothetical protein, partial [Longimicrobium sp.]|uniref:hypothetical protein n=1 Tax=Longimicrobium sp. TaxID=2029185 RepID=UPI002C102F5E
MAYPTNATNVSPTSLRIVRFAMLTGLLLFVGIAAYVHQSAPPEPVREGADLRALRMVGLAMCVAMMAGIFVLRGVRRRAAVEKRGTMALIGSAMGEAAALFGAVYFFLGGGLEVFALG